MQQQQDVHNSGDKEGETCHSYLLSADMVSHDSPQRYCRVRPEHSCIVAISSVDQNVHARSQHAGYSHLAERRLVGQAEAVHHLLEQTAQRMRSHAPERAYCGANQQCVTISVKGPSKAKNHYEQNLNINNHVRQHEHGDINPLSTDQPNKATGPEMIWRERHANRVSGSDG